MSTPLSPASVLLFTALPCFVLGCNHQNDRSDLGGGVSLPSLAGEPAATRQPDEASITTFDRRHWQPSVILVPVYGVAHGPTYTTEHRSTDATARQRGEHPTALTALELDGDTCRTNVVDALQTPFVCAWDALLLLPRAVVTRPWTEIRGDQEPYWRSSVWDARLEPVPRTAEPASPPTTAEPASSEAPR